MHAKATIPLAMSFQFFNFPGEVDYIGANHKRRDGSDLVHLVVFERGAGAAVIETLRGVSADEATSPRDRKVIQSQVFREKVMKEIVNKRRG